MFFRIFVKGVNGYELLDVIKENPYQNPQPYEKLVGDLAGAYLRRINIHHRLVYQVYEKEPSSKLLGFGRAMNKCAGIRGWY